MMSDRLDDILKQALAPDKEPADVLNQRIMRRVREEKIMNRTKRRIPAAALVAALVLGMGSVTALAAARFLSPAEVTEELGDEKLTQTFLGEDAISVNETQSFGGYDVTFLGIASGKSISDRAFYSDGSLREDRSYIVVSIANSDGTPMPEASSDEYDSTEFFVSPLIQGCDPVWYNAVTFGGALTETVVDGVRYRLMECDNVEIFADRELYLCVCDSTFYNNEAYVYDAESGEIARNEQYAGLNALFALPIDASKADPEAAKAYLESLDDEEDGTSTAAAGPAEGTGESEGATEEGSFEEVVLDYDEMMREQLGEEGYREWKAVQEWCDKLTPENIDEYAVPVEGTRQILVPDKDGYIRDWDWKVEGRSSGLGGSIKVDWLFKHADSENPMVLGGTSSSGRMDTAVVETLTLNPDGTVTFVVYIPKED